MIRITCGTCGTSRGYKTQADGALTLPAAEEQRLVRRGVAEYATRPIIGNGADSPVEDGDGGGAGIDPSDEDPPVEGLENGGGEYEAETRVGLANVADALDSVDGHFTRESLMEMLKPNMVKLAADLGVDISGCKNKGDIADLLVAVEVEASTETSDEDPPELGVEAPVV